MYKYSSHHSHDFRFTGRGGLGSACCMRVFSCATKSEILTDSGCDGVMSSPGSRRVVPYTISAAVL